MRHRDRDTEFVLLSLHPLHVLLSAQRTLQTLSTHCLYPPALLLLLPLCRFEGDRGRAVRLQGHELILPVVLCTCVAVKDCK